MRAFVPNGIHHNIARGLAPSSPPIQVSKPAVSKPPKAQKPPEPPREATAKQLFDAAWYLTRYPDAPADHEEAYRDYLAAGMKSGRFPSPWYENVKFPARARIPQEHAYRVTASPILCRVPVTRYLAPYQIKNILHRRFDTFDQYFHLAVVTPDLLGSDLWENDLRIIACMDSAKRRLAAEYSAKSPDTLISIIMPTRNRPDVIGDAIVSVIMQSYQEWELVIVDDASEEPATEAIVRQFDDKRIKYVRLDQRAGISAARNAGIEHSSGRVLAYLDDDDQWDPDHLLILFNQLRSHGARAAYSAYAVWDRFDPESRLGAGFKAIRFAPFNRSFLENTNYISLVAFMHERELLAEVGRFDPSLTRHVDWDLFLRMAEVTRPIAVPCILGHSFQGRATGGVSDCTDEERYLVDFRSKMAERSDWSQPFATADGAEHLATSLGRRARKVRRERLSVLPTESIQIVIPNYESRDELEMCLRSIAEHTPPPYEILIVDNGSSEETYTDLLKLPLSFDNVRVIREEANSGFSFAVNRGLNEVLSKHEKVLILNNDTLVTPDWLDELRYVLFKHNDAGMAVPRQVLPANSKASRYQMPGASIRFECDINLSAHHNNILNLDFDVEDGLVELSYAPLFCGLFRPETLEALGGLDSGNGAHYRSDWVLCDGIRRLLGQRIIYTPHSKIYHLQGVATRKRKSSGDGFLSQRSARPQAS